MKIKFDETAWADYLKLAQQNPALLRRINELIREIQRHPYSGIGKPEPLKHHLSGFWSRRINAEHRLVYALEGDAILIAMVQGHY